MDISDIRIWSSIVFTVGAIIFLIGRAIYFKVKTFIDIRKNKTSQ